MLNNMTHEERREKMFKCIRELNSMIKDPQIGMMVWHRYFDELIEELSDLYYGVKEDINN